MFCPKCGGVELETATNDKLEYLACINGCEGVWVLRSDLEKYWGKKKLKQLESELEEVKQPDFEKEAVVAEKEVVDMDTVEEDDDLYLDDDEDDYDDDEDDDFDEDYNENEEFDEIDEKHEEEEEEEDIEEVSFGNQRTLKRSFIDETDAEDEVVEAGDGFSSETELIEEEEEDLIHNDDEETMFLTSPVSGNPMKRFAAKVKDKIKCMVAKCPDSGGYWIDASDEVMAVLGEKSHPPKNFPDLLTYERPEEEVFEEEDEDEDSEDII